MVATRTTLAGRSTGPPAPYPSTLRAFIANRAKIDRNATYDFVDNHDIIGGNAARLSRSPGPRHRRCVRRQHPQHGGNYGYDGSINRTGRSFDRKPSRKR
jgi:hypothetical protein